MPETPAGVLLIRSTRNTPKEHVLHFSPPELVAVNCVCAVDSELFVEEDDEIEDMEDETDADSSPMHSSSSSAAAAILPYSSDTSIESSDSMVVDGELFLEEDDADFETDSSSTKSIPQPITDVSHDDTPSIDILSFPRITDMFPTSTLTIKDNVTALNSGRWTTQEHDRFLEDLSPT